MRIFFAIDLNKETKDILHAALHPLRSQHESIRWSKPENLHVTLQFLQEVKIEDIPDMLNHVREELSDFKEFNLKIGALELFPNVTHPKVLSLHVEPQDILTDLSIRIGKGIVTNGYDIEKRPFRGHITLAKITRPFALEQIEIPMLKNMFVKEVTLFQSEPSREGSRYTPLAIIKLF